MECKYLGILFCNVLASFSFNFNKLLSHFVASKCCILLVRLNQETLLDLIVKSLPHIFSSLDLNCPQGSDHISHKGDKNLIIITCSLINMLQHHNFISLHFILFYYFSENAFGFKKQNFA